MMISEFFGRPNDYLLFAGFKYRSGIQDVVHVQGSVSFGEVPVL